MSDGLWGLIGLRSGLEGNVSGLWILLGRGQ